MVGVVSVWLAPGITTQDVLNILTATVMGKIAVAAEQAWFENSVAPLARVALGVIVGALGTWVAAGYLSIAQTAVIFGGVLFYVVPGLREARAAARMIVTTVMLASYFTQMISDWDEYNANLNPVRWAE